MLKRAKWHALSLLGALILVASVSVPQAATASTVSDSSNSTTVWSPMRVVRYDAAVAEAHGYKIVTHADGSQESVPVTEEAKAQQAAAHASKVKLDALRNGGGGVSPQGVIDGDCGSSWINAYKSDNDTVPFTTGFVVFGAVIESQWNVVATGFISSNSVVLNPGPGDGTWSTEGALPGVVGPGYAYVNWPASFAVLAGGQVCYSGGPSSNWYN